MMRTLQTVEEEIIINYLGLWMACIWCWRQVELVVVCIWRCFVIWFGYIVPSRKSYVI